MNTEWSTPTKYIVSVGLVIFGLYILYLSQSVLTIIILAALVAFLLVPAVEFFHTRLKLPRGVAVLVTYVIVAVVLLLSPLVFLPPVIDGFNALSGIDYQVLIEDSLNWTESTLESLKDFNGDAGRFMINLDPIIDPALNLMRDTEQDITLALPSFQTIINSIRSAATVTVGVATNVAGTVFSGVFAFVVLVLSAVYISMDAHKFSGRFLALVPPVFKDEIAVLMHRLNRIWRAYFRGQLNLMIIIGTVTWLGNAALGLPGAFALGVIAGLMELIPNLGPFLAAIPAVIVALIQGSTIFGVSNWVFALIIVGFYILVQQFENTFVVPRVLGDAVDLHPLVVIIGVLIGTNVAGILGALLAAPVIASGREIIRYLYKKILGDKPFSSTKETEEPSTSALWAQGRHLLVKMQAMLLAQPSPPVSQPDPPDAPDTIEETEETEIPLPAAEDG